MTARPGTQLDLACECGVGRLIWESRQNSWGTRCLAVCSDPECGRITFPAGVPPEASLGHFLLDGQPLPARKPPYVRLFLAVSRISRWMAVERCWCCSGHLAFQTTVQGNPRRQIEPFALGLCLDKGCLEVGYWIAPTFNRIRLDGAAWDPLADAILGVKRALRRLTEPDLMNDDDWPVEAID